MTQSRAPSPLPAEARLAPSGPGAYLAGRRTRTSSSLLRAAPPTGPRAARAAPGLPRRFCRPRYDVAMATGRRRRGGSQAGDAAGGGRGDRKCPGGSAHPGPGPGPAPHGAWSGDRAPPGPNLDAGVAGTAARDPPLQRPGLRTRARVTFEFGPRDLASGVRTSALQNRILESSSPAPLPRPAAHMFATDEHAFQGTVTPQLPHPAPSTLPQ
uniref:Uncharacterized protein n=1 Tax=Rangifer tarandus platyrhynchus TaxID=3082113 RepID=A0ACB0EJ23_RANTA|nr:unnamed protein product [Rangifer tarandus platyrhynchus]